MAHWFSFMTDRKIGLILHPPDNNKVVPLGQTAAAAVVDHRCWDDIINVWLPTSTTQYHYADREKEEVSWEKGIILQEVDDDKNGSTWREKQGQKRNKTIILLGSLNKQSYIFLPKRAAGCWEQSGWQTERREMLGKFDYILQKLTVNSCLPARWVSPLVGWTHTNKYCVPECTVVMDSEREKERKKIGQVSSLLVKQRRGDLVIVVAVVVVVLLEILW